MLSRRMNRLAARIVGWLGDGKEFEGESLLQVAWELREFSSGMRLMELAACTREELFEEPSQAGDPPRARTDVISARLAAVAEELHEDWKVRGKIPAREMLEWTHDLLAFAEQVSDFETLRHPLPQVPPDIQPELPGNVVRLTPGKPGAKRGGK